MECADECQLDDRRGRRLKPTISKPAISSLGAQDGGWSVGAQSGGSRAPALAQVHLVRRGGCIETGNSIAGHVCQTAAGSRTLLLLSDGGRTQGEMEGGALVRNAFGPHPAAMLAHHTLHNAQTDTGTVEFALTMQTLEGAE